MRTLDYSLVDVFTSRPFGGNPLAVFSDPGELADDDMQRIANELNLSETTFVLPPSEPGKTARVRIFTPRAELPMAGHPTLGTAFVLLAHKRVPPYAKGRLIFEEGVGDIPVDYEMQNGQPGFLEMTQRPPRFGARFEDRRTLAAMLSLRPEQLAEGPAAQVVDCGIPILVVPLLDLQAAREARLRPDVWEAALANFESQEILIYTEQTEQPEMDLHARLFAPRLGITEDPATGSAMGPLGCYVVEKGLADAGCLWVEQGCELGRRSALRVEIERKSGEIASVRVGGRCVGMGRGAIEIASEPCVACDGRTES